MAGIIAKQIRRSRVFRWSLVVIVFSSLGILSVSAYLLDTDHSEIDMSVGYSEVELVEGFEQPEIKAGEITELGRQVQVRNIGRSDCKVRVKLSFSDESVLEYCELKYNETDWEYRSDGYWYYLNELETGESSAAITSALLNRMTINVPSDEQIKDFNVYVYAESWTE